MTGCARWLLAGLGVILASCSLIAYPVQAGIWPSLLTILALGLGLLGRRALGKPWKSALNAENIFLLGLSLVAAVQALQAGDYYSLQYQGIDRALSYDALLLLAHLAFSLYLLLHDSERPGQHALAAAILYTSLLYLPSFETAEAGLPFLAPSLLAVVVTWLAGVTQPDRLLPGRRGMRLQSALVVFLLLGLVAVGYSYSPGESLVWWLKLAALVLLVFQVPRLLPDWRSWQHMLIFVLLVAYLPVLWLSLEKYVQLALAFSPRAALTYRMNLIELGRANLIARELMIGWPVLFVFWRLARPGWLRWLLGLALGLGVVVFALCQSAGGLVGVGVMLLFAAWLNYRDRLIGKRSLIVMVLAGALLAAGIAGGVRIASQLNIGSFNGRLFQIRAGLLQIADYPLFGVGPGVYHLKAQYLPEIRWVTDARLTVDDPLLPVQWYQDSARLHAHNLWLEVGVGLGIPALLFFVLFLWDLFSYGVESWNHLIGEQRLLVGGVLIGIMAELGWGLLDVMQASPPFFSTSVWMLVGLILAAGKLTPILPDDGALMQNLSGWFKRGEFILAGGLGLALLVLGVGNSYFRQAYTHLREQAWRAAEVDLASALIWEPSNPKYQQLQAETLLNLAQYDEAALAYRQALNLKRDYAPYLRQLAWLAWLEGDLAGAEDYFHQAIQVDPHAAWSSDLYADLGLVLAAKGQEVEAIDALARDLRFDPTNATLAHWHTSLNESGEIEISLDRTYFEAIETSQELRKRIVAQLGQAGAVPETLTLPTSSSPFSIRKVFKRLEAGLSDPSADDGPLVILASLARAAQLTGLDHEANNYAGQFIQIAPESSFGYQVMAEIANHAGNCSAAETWLKQALEVSPDNLDILNLLAQVQLDQQDLTGARETLSLKSRNGSQNSLQYDFIDAELIRTLNRYYRETGDLAKARQTLEWLVLIQAAPDDYLALANMVQENGQMDSAADYCWQAYDLLVKRWVRPYDGRIWTAATCIAQSGETDEQINNRLNGSQAAFTSLLFQAHIARMRNETDLSVGYYQQAAELRVDDSAPHYYLGELYASLGEEAYAEGEFIRAAELDTKETLALLSLGRLYESGGNLDGALTAYQAAVARTPGWDEAQLALGNFYLKSGNFSQASTHFELARQLSGETDPARIYDFASTLASAGLTENVSEGYIKNGVYEIDGQRKFSIFMHPVSAAAYNLKLPELEDGAGLWLELSLGLLPDSWNQAGDGVNFTVELQTSDQDSKIFSAYVDPKHNPQDRQWKPARIDISAYAGEDITLTLRTDGGEAGDLQFDWACWGEPVIVASR